MTLCYPTAFAVGFGEAKLRSNLGEPLRMQVPLNGAAADVLVPDCVKPKIETLNGDLIDVPRVEFVLPSSPSGPAYLNLLSSKVMVEPAIKVVVAMTCGGLVSRDYTLLLDFAELAPSPVPANVPSAQADTQVAPTIADQQKTAKPPGKQRFAPSAPGPGIEKNRTQPAKAVTTARPSKSRQVTGKDVLHVTSEENLLETDLKLSENLSESTTTNVNPDQQRLAENKLAQAQFAAVLRGEDPLTIAQNAIKSEEQKIKALEQEIKKINDMNAQRELEEKKFSPLLIGLIATLTTLFLALIALVVVAVRKSKSKENTWWDSSAEKKQNVADIVDYLQTTAESGELDPNPITATREVVVNETTPVKEEPPQQPINKEEPAPKFKRMGLPSLEDSNSSTFNFFGEQGQSIQIEEISDITQEAEFWMSVNDPHRAIEILEPASRDDNQATPVTWLYLLDLYRLVGDEDNYRDLRNRFKQKFNAKIPNFHEEIQPGSVRNIEDFPHLVSKCCAFWDTDEIIVFLESLLVDDREGERVGFDLPVYRDILFLLSIAHELKRPQYTSALKKKEPATQASALNQPNLSAMDAPAQVSDEEAESHDVDNSLNFDLLEFKSSEKGKN